jgi:hypothetical protein
VSDHDPSHPLRPTLQATELRLQEALDEVCEETVIPESTTDELILIEETLEIAHEEAKRAVSLRRKIRQDT